MDRADSWAMDMFTITEMSRVTGTEATEAETEDRAEYTSVTGVCMGGQWYLPKPVHQKKKAHRDEGRLV